MAYKKKTETLEELQELTVSFASAMQAVKSPYSAAKRVSCYMKHVKEMCIAQHVAVPAEVEEATHWLDAIEEEGEQ